MTTKSLRKNLWTNFGYTLAALSFKAFFRKISLNTLSHVPGELSLVERKGGRKTCLFFIFWIRITNRNSNLLCMSVNET